MKLSNEQIHWLEVCHGEELEKLLNPPVEKKTEWTRGENQTDEDAAHEHSFVVADKFRATFPQFVRSAANYEAISRRRQELGIARYVDWSYDKLVEIFRALVLEGALEVNPRAIGLDHDIVSGYLLKKLIRERRGYEALLDPWTPKSAEDAEAARIRTMTAAQWDAYCAEKEARELEWARPAAFDPAEFRMFQTKRTDYLDSPHNQEVLLEAARKEFGDVRQVKSDQIVQLFDEAWRAGKIGKVSANRFSVGQTHYQSGGNTEPNRPPDLPDNATLRRWIQSHDSFQFDLRLQQDPEFRRAVDQLEAA